MLVLTVTTPPIAINDGEGYDGHEYALMVRFFRDGTPVRIHEPWVYRIGPSWLVAQSGLDTKVAFMALNAAATLASGLMLLRLLRRYGVGGGHALLAIFWWTTLAPGVRLSPVYYPVLLDAIGFCLLMGLVMTALDRRILLFGATLTAASLTRENLLMIAPFLWFCLRELGAVRAGLLTAAASMPALVVFAAVRLTPVLEPSVRFESIDVIMEGLQGIATNRYYQTWRFLFAPFFAFGALATLALWRIARLRGSFGRHAEWTYFIAASALVTILGALDPERRVYLAAPAALLIAFIPGPKWAWSSGWRIAALTGTQILASRVLWPIGSDESTFREFSLTTMLPRTLAIVGLYEAFLAMLTLVVLALPANLRDLRRPAAWLRRPD